MSPPETPSGGVMTVPLCGMYCPLPPRLYGSPLKMGESWGACWYFGQSQYYRILDAWKEQEGGKDTMRNWVANGLVAAVAALITEGGLVDVNKPAMPGHEIPGEVERQGLIDVDGNKVVKLTARACQLAPYARIARIDNSVFDVPGTLLPVLRWPACAPASAGDT